MANSFRMHRLLEIEVFEIYVPSASGSKVAP
jgi:hypothetical protein